MESLSIATLSIAATFAAQARAGEAPHDARRRHLDRT